MRKLFASLSIYKMISFSFPALCTLHAHMSLAVSIYGLGTEEDDLLSRALFSCNPTRYDKELQMRPCTPSQHSTTHIIHIGGKDTQGVNRHSRCQ